MAEKRKYDSSVARIAGNIVGALLDFNRDEKDQVVVQRAVAIARAIVAEVERTEPGASAEEP